MTLAAIQATRAELEEYGDEGDFLRVFLTLEDTPSPQYGVKIESELRPGDVVMNFDGLTVVVGRETVRPLRGTVIDYVELPIGTGFKFHRGVGSEGPYSLFRPPRGAPSEFSQLSPIHNVRSGREIFAPTDPWATRKRDGQGTLQNEPSPACTYHLAPLCHHLPPGDCDPHLLHSKCEQNAHATTATFYGA